MDIDLDKECGRTDASVKNAKDSAVCAENCHTILTSVGQDAIMREAGRAVDIATEIGHQVIDQRGGMPGRNSASMCCTLALSSSKLSCLS
jgi:hypothetical protein